MGELYRRQTDTCLLIFNCFQTERATRQRRPLWKLKTQLLTLLARRWKRSLQLGICTGMRWEHFTDSKQNNCLLILNCSQAQRATRQRRPLLQQKGQRLALPARHWKRLLELCICRGDVMGTLYRRQTKYLFANLQVFISGEGDEATSPSFIAENQAIDASNALLEALIATRYM